MATALRIADVEKDVPALAVLARVTFANTFQHYPPEELAGHLAHEYSEDRIRELLRHPLRRTWVVERDGELVGYAVAGEGDLPHPEVSARAGQLHRLYLLPPAQGGGWGRALMDAALAWLAEQGRAPVFIGVWENNLRAQAFYRRFGFEPVGEYPYPVGSTMDRELILRGG